MFYAEHGQLQPAGVVSTGIGKGIDRFLRRTSNLPVVHGRDQERKQ